ncbi:MAG: signal recognition particle-docking protein FtsY [Eubacteriaceae bacterium]|nr:signal recognition particle-docking protein FtsY [Eubacteriaceae bacterium]
MEKERTVFDSLRAKSGLGGKLKALFSGEITDEIYDDMTEALILSDIPYETAEKIMDGAKGYLKRSAMKDETAVIEAVKKSMMSIIEQTGEFRGFSFPCVILIMGVNGVGKTTTIAKLAYRFKASGRSVMLAAADTFRAAASEQLGIWAEKLNVPMIAGNEGQDPSSVIFDALDSFKAKHADVLICDTAGRLQNKKNLMDELSKLNRVCEKNSGGAELYTLIVADAMTGRNTLDQIEQFSKIRKPDGVILTKIDGTAKGGAVFAAADIYKIPVCFLGIGEAMGDLIEFNAEDYIEGML